MSLFLAGVFMALSFFLGFAFGMFSQRSRIQRLQGMCDYDSLTGLRKSRDFERQALQCLKKAVPLEEGERSALSSRRTGTVVFLDVDGFKKANDSLGHDTGDEILRVLSKVVSMNLRHKDMATRRSDAGDEFILLFIGATIEDAESILLKVREQFENAISWAFPSLSGSVSFSFGTARIRSTDTVLSVKKALSRAEEKMREDKESRKMAR